MPTKRFVQILLQQRADDDWHACCIATVAGRRWLLTGHGRTAAEAAGVAQARYEGPIEEWPGFGYDDGVDIKWRGAVPGELTTLQEYYSRLLIGLEITGNGGCRGIVTDVLLIPNCNAAAVGYNLQVKYTQHDEWDTNYHGYTSPDYSAELAAAVAEQAGRLVPRVADDEVPLPPMEHTIKDHLARLRALDPDERRLELMAIRRCGYAPLADRLEARLARGAQQS